MLLDFRSVPIMLIIQLIYLLLLSLILVSPAIITSYGVLPWFLAILLIMQLIFFQLMTAEKIKLETLQATLPLTRDDIVKARYLYFVCILAIVIIPPVLMKLLFFPDNELVYFYLFVTFPILSFLAAVMYPVYFKIKSAAAKISICMIFAGLISGISGGGWREIFAFVGRSNRLMPVIAGLLLICLSYLLSVKIYRTRDL